MMCEGIWWLRSESDPRWNAKGRGIVGGLVMSPEAKATIALLKKKLGEEPPEDLEFGYLKD